MLKYNYKGKKIELLLNNKTSLKKLALEKLYREFK